MAAGASGARNEFGKNEIPGTAGGKPAAVRPVVSDRSEAELFQRVRARLRAAVGEDVFNSWFARLELEEIVEDKAHLSVPTRFLCSWIQSNYAEKIHATPFHRPGQRPGPASPQCPGRGAARGRSRAHAGHQAASRNDPAARRRAFGLGARC